MLTLLVLLAHTSEATPIPVVPTDHGAGVRRASDVRRFSLDEGTWRYDHLPGAPRIREGWVLVLRADPALLVPRQVAHPVPYVGTVPLQVLAADVASGCAVGALPAWVDPAAEPWFFGSIEPPERVDEARGEAERAAAVQLGVRPRPAEEQRRWASAATALPSPAALSPFARTLLVSCIDESPGEM